MKNLRSESDKEKAQELLKIIEQRKRLEKAESELKEYFKAICDGESAYLNGWKMTGIAKALQRSTPVVERNLFGSKSEWESWAEKMIAKGEL